MYRTQYDKEAKLWSGCNIPPLYNPKISLAQALLKSCEVNGSKIAQISDNNGIQLTYDEIRIKSIRAAQNLQKRGYGTKQVFGVLARNSHHLAPIVFASMSLGCPVNGLDTSFGKNELLHMLKITKPALMFCDLDMFKILRECLAELGNNAKIFTFGGSDDISEPVENLPTKVDGEKEIALIICSSGTTGLSKGVSLSHAGMLDAVSSFNLMKSTDVFLCFSSLYWISGWIILLGGTLYGGTRIITTELFSPELQLRLIEQNKVTFALSAPHHLAQISKCDRLRQIDLSHFRVQLVGGSSCSFEVQNQINSHLSKGRVCTFYGLSEASWGFAMNSSTSTKDCVGQLLSGYKVKIIDDNGNRCGIGEKGEICFKPNYPFLGYFGNQKATDAAFDDEAFFMTADIGYFDEDGDLSIVDREKDLIKYCNFQISPSQIESFLIGSPDVKSVCVVGVPDEVKAREFPTAFVIRAENSKITEKDIVDMVAENFADYCKLRGGVRFVQNLPLTPSGKIIRRIVREQAQQLVSCIMYHNLYYLQMVR